MLLKRPVVQPLELEKIVEEIFDAVEKDGDEAVKNYAAKFDQVELKKHEIDQAKIENASNFISEELRNAMQLAKANIEKFHQSQFEKTIVVETSPGVRCWRESRPIEKVGLYIPGGTAPLFSTVLMLGVPAKLAGCSKIILCSPPNQSRNIHPAILYAAHLVGITQVYAVGGIQAIAAMSLGTPSIPNVDKIFGPGNQYVNAAKQFALKYGVAIDLPAGPSELLIIADKSSVPEFVAADLLSQAEHGPDSQVMLLTDSEEILKATLSALEKQLNDLPRKEIASAALKFSKAILLESIDECIAMSNLYAPEHLILATENSHSFLSKISNAGSVFLGNFSCESAGDYASGTNHTLPTNGFARNYSGVSLDSFLKKITVQEVSKMGLANIGKAIEEMAAAEQLMAHKNAVSIRIKTIDNHEY